MELFQLVEDFFEIGEIIELDKATEELQKIDPNFTPQLFSDIVLATHFQMQATALYDKNSIGSLWQAHLTAMLRQSLLALGWKMENLQGGRYLTISPCRTKSIIVAIGTSDVGKLEGFPKTNAKKGITWERAIAQHKLDLADTCEFWVLLFHYNDEVLQSELSLPSDFIKNQVTGYIKRIIFKDISLKELSETDISRQQSEPAEIDEPTAERKKKTA